MDLTPLNILYLVLALSVFMVSIFLCVVLFQISQVLKDAREVIARANELVDQVNTYIAKPIKMAMEITKRFKQIAAVIQSRFNAEEDKE